MRELIVVETFLLLIGAFFGVFLVIAGMGFIMGSSIFGGIAVLGLGIIALAFSITMSILLLRKQRTK